MNFYRFRYIPEKTRGKPNPTPFNVLLEHDLNPLVEALILQDHDRAYLHELRVAAIAGYRPLSVRPDGLQCPYGWYGRAWSRYAGTGGHIARTLINDEFAGGPIDDTEVEELGFDPSGDFAVRFGMITNHHTASKTARRYRSELSQRKNVRAGQMILRKRAATFGE